MMEEADRFKDEDKKKREVVEARNIADAMIHSTEKSMKDLGDKVSAGDKGRVETAISELREALKSEDVEAIKAKTNALTQASMKLGEALYGAQQAGGPVAVPTQVRAAASRRRAVVARTSSTPTSRKSRTTRRSPPDRRFLGENAMSALVQPATERVLGLRWGEGSCLLCAAERATLRRQRDRNSC